VGGSELDLAVEVDGTNTQGLGFRFDAAGKIIELRN
jgi:hypothetical protein